MSDLVLRAEVPGKFRVALHRPSRSIECDMLGFWSRDDAIRFCAVLDEEMAQLRRQRHQAKVLFDMSTSRTQILTAMTVPRSPTMIVEGDKVAVVTTSALLRLAMKQQRVMTEQHAYFTEREAGQYWLRS